jgi:hypothetical protein
MNDLAMALYLVINGPDECLEGIQEMASQMDPDDVSEAVDLVERMLIADADAAILKLVLDNEE